MLFKTDGAGELDLPDGEYIRLVGLNSGNAFTHYLRSIADIKADIQKYKYNYNLFIGLATTRGQEKKAENMRTRKVLLLDFDKKDYPEFKTVDAFTNHIKSILPQLYIHMIVDTGHGYHCYIAINQCVDTERVTAANKALAEIVGADVKATLPTQLARIPTSINLKDPDNKKSVNIVCNSLERSPAHFKAYHLQKIEGIIEQVQQNQKNLESTSPLPQGTYNKISSYHCIECMLAEGAKEGARNFCLGRITNYLKTIKGYTEDKALKTVQEWNRKCQPPKPPRVIEDDFKRYWQGNYKLLGCTLADEHDQQILNHYCDKLRCTSIFEPTRDTEIQATEMFFDNNILRNKVIQDLTGFHLLILSVLDFADKPLNKNNLIQYLTGRRTKKCCISQPTLNKVLSELMQKEYVIFDKWDKTFSINRKSYKPTYTRYAYSATIQFINRIITPTEYLVYLCLVRNLQQNKNVTYETLAADLDKPEQHIGGYIKGLHQAGLINIYKNYNDRGILYNTYKILY